MEQFDAIEDPPKYEKNQKDEVIAQSRRNAPNLLFILEIAILVTTFVFVAGLYTIPVVYQYVYPAEDTNTTAIQEMVTNRIAALSAKNLTFDSNAPLACDLDSDLLAGSWTNINLNPSVPCAAEVYIGSICKPYLRMWQSCVETDNLDVFIAPYATPQANREFLVSTFDSLLDPFPDCKKEALPFLCQYLFPLINCTSGRSHSSSQGECVRIATTICLGPWTVAAGDPAYRDFLPDCDILPQGNSVSSSNASNASNSTGVTCHEDFLEEDSLCYPRCDKFAQSSGSAGRFLSLSGLISVVILAVLSILILLFSVWTHKEMYTYPSVLVVFMASTLLVLALVSIIYGSNSDNYCSSENLLDSVKDYTVFNNIAGAIFHYCFMTISIWWLAHVAIIFIKVVFPRQSQNIKTAGLQKFILIGVIILGLVIPLPSTIVGLAVEDYEFGIRRFPPGLPAAEADIYFYSVIFYNCIIVCVGVCLMITTGWYLLRQKCFTVESSYRENTSDKLVMVYFASFVVSSAFVLIQYSVLRKNYNKFTDGLAEYFFCEALGYVPGRCSRDVFEDYTNPYLDGFTLILILLIPVCMIIFVIGSRKWRTKEICKWDYGIDTEQDKNYLSGTNKNFSFGTSE